MWLLLSYNMAPVSASIRMALPAEVGGAAGHSTVSVEVLADVADVVDAADKRLDVVLAYVSNGTFKVEIVAIIIVENIAVNLVNIGFFILIP